MVDDSRSAWAQVATLARTSGFFATVDGQGSLVFGPSQTTPAKKFGYGVDILALEVAESAPLAARLTVVGEGAAGSQGSDAWSWLIKDPAAVAASAGLPGRVLSPGPARSKRREERGRRRLRRERSRSPSQAGCSSPARPRSFAAG